MTSTSTTATAISQIGSKTASEAFWNVLKMTTGIRPEARDVSEARSSTAETPKTDKRVALFIRNDGESIDTETKGMCKKRDRVKWKESCATSVSKKNEARRGDVYETKESDLDDVSAQRIALAAFERKLGTHTDFEDEEEAIKLERSATNSLDWSNEICQVVVEFKEHVRLRPNKPWSQEKLCRKLRSLRLRDCDIERIDKDMQMFRQLQELSLSTNRIASLGPLPKSLKVLNAYNNKLQSIERTKRSPAIDFPDLIGLGLGYNNFLDASTVVENFPSLRVLDLSYNSLTSIECVVETLRGLKSLSHLALMGNPCSLLLGYRRYVVSALPTLVELDGVAVQRNDDGDVHIDPLEPSLEKTIRFRVRVETFAQSRDIDRWNDAVHTFQAKRDRLAKRHADEERVVKVDAKRILKEEERKSATFARFYELDFAFAGRTWKTDVFEVAAGENACECVHSIVLEIDPSVQMRDSIASRGLVCTLYEHTPKCVIDANAQERCKDVDEDSVVTTKDSTTPAPTCNAGRSDIDDDTDGNNSNVESASGAVAGTAAALAKSHSRSRVGLDTMDTQSFLLTPEQQRGTLTYRSDDVDWEAYLASDAFARSSSKHVALTLHEASMRSSWKIGVTVEMHPALASKDGDSNTQGESH
eukprot:g4576.t1